MIKYKKGTLLFLLALFLLPFEAIKGILPSVYRPISLYPLSIVFIFAVFKEVLEPKYNKMIFRYFVFASYCVVSSYIVTWIKFGDFHNTTEFAVTLVMGMIVFVASNYAFKLIKGKDSNDQYIYYVFKLLGNMYFFAIIIGIIEMLSILNIIPISIKANINKILGAGQLTRVCMGSSEASWLSMHLLMMMPIYIYLYRRTKLVRYMVAFILLCGIFTFNVSGQGITTLIITFFIYFFINIFKKNNLKGAIKNLALIVFGLVGAFVIFKFIVSILPNTYYTVRIKNFTTINGLISSDQSSFIRIIYPYLDFRIFLNNPIFGIGGGNFPKLLGNYLAKFYPWAISAYGEVAVHVSSENASTGSFYVRLLGEFGIVGFMLFWYFASVVIKKFGKVRNCNQRNLVMFILITTFALLIQFDSFTYVPFWVMLAFFNNFEEDKIIKEKNIK